jgi:hypothetical protein
VVRNVTKAEAFATGFAAAFSVSGLEGSGMTAAAMWRPTTAAVNAAAGNAPAMNTAAMNTAHLQTVAVAQILKPAALHTQQYVVTTPDAGRDNKGTSPWGFPV